MERRTSTMREREGWAERTSRTATEGRHTLTHRICCCFFFFPFCLFLLACFFSVDRSASYAAFCSFISPSLSHVCLLLSFLYFVFSLTRYFEQGTCSHSSSLLSPAFPLFCLTHRESNSQTHGHIPTTSPVTDTHYVMSL